MIYREWVAAQDSVRVETRFHEFDVAYRETGSGSPTTLFLHGIPTWGFLFRDVYTAVDHAVVPDLAGYGYTNHIGKGGYDRSIRLQEELVMGFLDELDHDSVQIVAHDIGGSTALRLAAHSPERVEKLVLSNAGCYDNWPVPFIHAHGQPDKAREWTEADVEENLQAIFGDGTVDDDNEAFVSGMKAPILERDRKPQDFARNAISTNTNHTLEIAHLIPDIEFPVLLLWGGGDVLVSTEWADKLAEDLPNAKKEYLADAYHWVMEDCSEDYRTALSQFLD